MALVVVNSVRISTLSCFFFQLSFLYSTITFSQVPILQLSTDIDEIDQKIDLLVNRINIDQSEALSLRLAAAFVAGSNSITSTIYSKDKKKLSEQQERAIKQLSAAHFGYISEFNRQMGEQLKDHAREILRQEGGYKEIASYTKDVLGGSENVVINNVGKTRKIIQVGKDGTLSEVEKVITRPYITTVDNYADMLGRTAHTLLGLKVVLLVIRKWVFIFGAL